MSLTTGHSQPLCGLLAPLMILLPGHGNPAGAGASYVNEGNDAWWDLVHSLPRGAATDSPLGSACDVMSDHVWPMTSVACQSRVRLARLLCAAIRQHDHRTYEHEFRGCRPDCCSRSQGGEGNKSMVCYRRGKVE